MSANRTQTRPSSAYADLVKRAAERAKPEADPVTHMEKRELGWRRFNVMLPPATHRAFKLACIRDELEMADVAQALIESWIEHRRRLEAADPGLFDDPAASEG